MRYLIVGGPHDGDWFNTEPEEFIQRAVRQPVSWSSPLAEAPELMTVNIATYKRRQWRAQDRVRFIYAPPEMTDLDVFDALLAGYASCKPAES